MKCQFLDPVSKDIPSLFGEAHSIGPLDFAEAVSNRKFDAYNRLRCLDSSVEEALHNAAFRRLRMFLVPAVCLLLFAADSDEVSNNEIIICGRIVDSKGHPVAKAKFGTIWSPNGWFDENGKRRFREGKDAKETADLLDLIWGTQGPMMPISQGRNSQDHNQFASDDQGIFTCSVGRFDSLLLAMDGQQKSAGIIDFDAGQVPSELVIRMTPAVEVTGTMIVQSTGKVADWSIVYVNLPSESADPMSSRRLVTCGTLNGKFKLKLPPGSYEIDAHSDIRSDIPYFESEPIQLVLTGDKLQVDVGEIMMIPAGPTREQRIEVAKKERRTVDVKDLTGKPLPSWYMTDARGIDPKGGIEQFQGRWTLIYFWHPNCRPCAVREVPRLVQFAANQNPTSDKIAVISFLLAPKSWKTMAEADKELGPIGKRYWGNEWEKLPQAFDSTCRTRESIAEELFGQWVLVDPNGIVEATGDDTGVGIDTIQKRSSP